MKSINAERKILCPSTFYRSNAVRNNFIKGSKKETLT